MRAEGRAARIQNRTKCIELSGERDKSDQDYSQIEQLQKLIMVHGSVPCTREKLLGTDSCALEIPISLLPGGFKYQKC